MSKVSELRVPSAGKNRGKFRVGVFNLFVAGEREAYEELRTKDNDRTSGIVIEHMQQFTRVVTESVAAEEGQTTTRTEDLHVLVQYWEERLAAPERVGGESEVPRDWYAERSTDKP